MMEQNETFGKCNFVNLENGLKCGCLRYRNNRTDNLLCEGCKHDQTFHEYNNHQTSPLINTSRSPINMELNSIFKKRKVSVRSDFGSHELNATRNPFNPYQQHIPINNNKHKNQKSSIF
jgi:hypothetical protein